jgi:Glycosyl transferase family, a/b domain/Glycosyl transferase family, helical bundle domain/Glutamine amidotransferase class-I
VEKLVPARNVVSPGPCTRNEAGISVPLIKAYAGKIPILGVCPRPPLAQEFPRRRESMTPQEALARVIEHREIFREEMLGLMRAIMSGEVSPTLIAAIVTGLRVKKETVGEIAAAAEVMREFATGVPVPDEPNLIDTCGTGGDGAHSFNISTAAMFVAAAAGAKIAKHGGRSVSAAGRGAA